MLFRSTWGHVIENKEVGAHSPKAPVRPRKRSARGFAHLKTGLVASLKKAGITALQGPPWGEESSVVALRYLALLGSARLLCSLSVRFSLLLH